MENQTNETLKNAQAVNEISDDKNNLSMVFLISKIIFLILLLAAAIPALMIGLFWALFDPFSLILYLVFIAILIGLFVFLIKTKRPLLFFPFWGVSVALLIMIWFFLVSL